ncbi:uncharacterized protein LOC119696667 isoform X2 [Motacilla alba alba]|uniref:uncharacterized protein LOC119696667 isoform X2 n=1 Tax=Motacilla alba alba TaxID=1094192 RepID=UPI0018D53CEC|nr:uncharacterized protein LOC119696667 isoform X2 [Motacilla alba alba]XP_037982392.1 uncharacterized protein LOC119696667 isoform X2 [Motacilla alba alba]
MAERPIPGAEVRPSRKSSRIAAIKLKRARQSTRSGTRVAFGNGGGVAADPATTAWPPSTAQSCRPRTRAFLGERRLRDNSPVTAGTSQMARRPCFAPDTDRVPQMSEVLMHYILVRAPHPGLVGSPEQEVKPESSSQGQVGKAIDFAYVQPPPPASPCTGFPAHVGLVEVLQDSAMKPLNFLIHRPISTLRQRRQPPSTAKACGPRSWAFLRMHPIPGSWVPLSRKSRQIAAVKAKWARQLTRQMSSPRHALANAPGFLHMWALWEYYRSLR